MIFKKVTLAMLLALPAMVACGGKQSYKETRTEEEVINELAANAISEIGVSYNKFAGDGVALGETELVTAINQKVWDGDEKGLNYSVSYTLSAQEEYQTEYLKLNETGDGLIAELVVGRDLEGFDIASSLNAAAYTLSAKIKFVGYAEGFVAPKGLKTTDSFVGKEIAKKSWNALVKAAQSGSIHEVCKAEKDAMVFTTGIVTAAYDWNYEEIFRGVIIADGSEGALLYSGCLQTAFYDDEQSDANIKIGDVVEVYGAVSPYNGLFEIKPQLIRVVKDANLEELGLEEPTFREMTAKEVKESKQENTGDLVRVKGLKLKEGTDLASLSAGSHWTINVVDTSGDEIAIYVNYHIGANAQNSIKAMLTEIGTGTFTFQGILSAYNAMQLTPMAFDGNAGACFLQD